MKNCEFEPWNEEAIGGPIWWEYPKYVRIEEDRVVIKSYDNYDNGNFLYSIIIPTATFPLVNNRFEVFTAENTHWLKAEEYPEIMQIFDSVEPDIGMCYENVERLCPKLMDAGYDAHIYTGWMVFHGHPIMHAWIVLNIDGKRSILDLSSYYWFMMTELGIDVVSSGPDYRERNVKAFLEADKYPNSVKCAPVGLPYLGSIYVGCPSTGRMGRKLAEVIGRVDDHPIFQGKQYDSAGFTLTQHMIKEARKGRSTRQ